mgnify:CR=1 FL=1
MRDNPKLNRGELFVGGLMRTFFMKTERVGFSVWKPEDIALAQRLWLNPEVTKYICASGSFSQREVKERLEKESG